MTIESTPVTPVISTAAPVKEEYVGKPAEGRNQDPVSESLRLAAEKRASTEAPQAEVEPVEKVEDTSKQEEDLGPRFAALSRREKQLVEREKAAKQIQEQFTNFNKAIENIKSDPLAALKEVGLSFEDLAQAYLASQDPAYEPSAEDKIKKLEERLSQREQDEIKAREKAEQAKLDQEQRYIEENIANFKDGIRKQVDSQADKYELIQANNAYDMVYEVVASYYEQNEEMLDPTIAMDHVENYLEEEARKVLSLKKFAPKSTEQSSLIRDNTPDVRANPSTTLTNRNVSHTGIGDKPKGLSREESLKRAASIIKWD